MTHPVMLILETEAEKRRGVLLEDIARRCRWKRV